MDYRWDGNRMISVPNALILDFGEVPTDPDCSVLREARELKMVVAAVPLLASPVFRTCG